MTQIPLGRGAEFDRIREIARRLGARAGELGDDCAWVPAGDEWVALSTDVSVDGVHFRREWLTLEEIGWRATASALSDLAAAGARGAGVLVAVTLPAGEPAESLYAIMEGAGAAVESVGGRVIGGDLSAGETLSIAVTVAGGAPERLGRVGAKAGDALWVTGQLGGARAALLAWQSGRAPDSGARTRFAKPVPRIAEGLRLRPAGAHAMIDLSDGLGGDAAHLAAASGVELLIDLERLPLDPSVTAEAARQGVAPALFAAQGGEDYELLAAMPAGFQGIPGMQLTRIGEVRGDGGGVRFRLEGREVSVPGFSHFGG